MRHLRDKVKKTLVDFAMIEQGASLLLCVSGGVDSMALLDIFSSLKDELNIQLAVCHLNHNLRGDESIRDQSFVEKAAKEKGLPFFTRTLTPGGLNKGSESSEGGSLQERARQARYAFFAETAQSIGTERIVLAHNLDDQSETVLMRILKGSGLKGLRGMPAVRGPYIRPLIEVTRAEIEDYVKERGVEFVKDSSNESMKYLRNKLRLELIPEIEEQYNPMIKEALRSLAKSAEIDYSFIENEAGGLFERAKEEIGETRVVFSKERLCEAHPALSTRVFLMAVETLKGNAREIYRAHVDSFLALIRSTEPGTSVDLPGGLRLRREYEDVILESAPESGGEFDPGSGYDLVLALPGVTKLGESGSSFIAEILEETPEAKGVSKDVAFFDLDVLESLGGPLMVRNFRAGDRMTPMGMEGVKKLQDIFVDDKVARVRRTSVPLLVCDGVVLWIAGLRQSECAKLTPKTKRTLRVERKSGLEKDKAG